MARTPHVESALAYAACLFIGLSAVAYLVTQLAPFNAFLLQRKMDRDSAEAYLSSDVCSDPSLRAATDRINKCKDAEMTVQQDPRLLALYDTMSEIRRNSILYDTTTLVLIGILVLLFVLCGGMSMFIRLRDSAMRKCDIPLSLPSCPDHKPHKH